MVVPGGKLQAANYDKTFIDQIEEKYQALEDKFTRQYKNDLKKEENNYEHFLRKSSDEQKLLEKLLNEDISYLEEVFNADYKKLEAKYGAVNSYNTKLNQYKNQINPDYSIGAMWKYSKESDKNYSTSLHWKLKTQINPDYSTSLMWKYKNEVNPSYSTSTMWKYSNTVNPSYSTSLMWKLRNESNPDYSTSTMWSYKREYTTLENTKKSIESILKTGDEELQEARNSAINTIQKLRNRTISDVEELRDETVNKLIKQRTTSLEDISSLRDSLFGSGIQVKPLYISFNSIKVFIDGELQQFEQSPIIIKGNTLVPMRAIFERLGATIEWNQKQQSVLATKGDTTINLKIGSTLVLKNGQDIKLAVPAQTTNSYTMVPLRFISEALGAEVKWNGDTQTITITTQ
ncbi:MAG TPA: copper amine oxidase N-terminal domain-containing protein [Candidatus Paenibacillus intestinavium]|nr:copper amine oxidase N-terminal domain-containing protein [Candidatus Paenibacillus intestinavium]